MVIFFLSGVIDYNFLCFRDAITQVFELRNKSQNAAKNRSEVDLLQNGSGDSTENVPNHLQVQIP